jgi:hypothetical protein
MCVAILIGLDIASAYIYLYLIINPVVR